MKSSSVINKSNILSTPHFFPNTAELKTHHCVEVDGTVPDIFSPYTLQFTTCQDQAEAKLRKRQNRVLSQSQREDRYFEVHVAPQLVNTTVNSLLDTVVAQIIESLENNKKMKQVLQSRTSKWVSLPKTLKVMNKSTQHSIFKQAISKSKACKDIVVLGGLLDWQPKLDKTKQSQFIDCKSAVRNRYRTEKKASVELKTNLQRKGVHYSSQESDKSYYLPSVQQDYKNLDNMQKTFMGKRKLDSELLASHATKVEQLGRRTQFDFGYKRLNRENNIATKSSIQRSDTSLQNSEANYSYNPTDRAKKMRVKPNSSLGYYDASYTVQKNNNQRDQGIFDLSVNTTMGKFAKNELISERKTMQSVLFDQNVFEMKNQRRTILPKIVGQVSVKKSLSKNLEYEDNSLPLKIEKHTLRSVNNSDLLEEMSLVRSSKLMQANSPIGKSRKEPSHSTLSSATKDQSHKVKYNSNKKPPPSFSSNKMAQKPLGSETNPHDVSVGNDSFKVAKFQQKRGNCKPVKQSQSRYKMQYPYRKQFTMPKRLPSTNYDNMILNNVEVQSQASSDSISSDKEFTEEELKLLKQ